MFLKARASPGVDHLHVLKAQSRRNRLGDNGFLAHGVAQDESGLREQNGQRKNKHHPDILGGHHCHGTERSAEIAFLHGQNKGRDGEHHKQAFGVGGDKIHAVGKHAVEKSSGQPCFIRKPEHFKKVYPKQKPDIA